MKRSLLLTQLILLSVCGFSQTSNYWSATELSRSNLTKDKAVNRATFPTEFKLFSLNVNPLKEILLATVKNRSASPTIITLPNATGGLEDFEVYEASNFEPALQARFPEIRSFSGKGVTDKAATLKLSFSPQGIQTIVFRTEKENEFIEPYSQDHRVYAVFAAQPVQSNLPWSCKTPDEQLATDLNQQLAANSITARSGGNLKTLRLAISVTGEYSNYHGATSASQVGLVLAAVNATLTHCNGVYERDLAVHMNLVTASTNVFYYNPVTDPYTVSSYWNNQVQRILTTTIGEANYDIGHLFTSQPEGGAAASTVCVNGSKGSGFSSTVDGAPTGYSFDCMVMHEMGHQMGARHTYSFNGTQLGSAIEVSSGITIMSYAGVTSQDVAGNRNDIYHQRSIAEIETRLATQTCPVTSTITNATPVVASVSNYTIPKSTPFALTGAATDANNSDILTYCWEQNDGGSASQAVNNSVASPTKIAGPNWLSFSPTTSPTRYFPQLATILAGGQVTGPLPGGDSGVTIEALSSVARTLNFRLTVRDNAPCSSTAPVSVGQTAFRDMTVTVNATSGPFVVTAPNIAVNWAGGSAQTITWSVANTTAAPVSCANVKISLSTDGGQTFPTVLAASTPNDGSEVLAIPNTPSTTARIKIEAIGNIFFDISNKNFTIEPACLNAFEPNETMVTAATLTSGITSAAAISSAADVDYFKITVPTTSDMLYTLTAPTGVNYNLYVYNSAGTQLGSATGNTTTESVSLNSLTQGTYYIKVIGFNGANSFNCYTIRATARPSASCQSSYDIVSNAGTVGAVDIPFNTNVTGLISPSGDIDYYKFTVTTTGTLTLTLTGMPADYNLKLFNSGGTQISGSQNSGTTSETINYTTLAGIYYAQVSGYIGTNNATSCYTLRVQTGTATRSITEVPETAIAFDKSVKENALSAELSKTGNVSIYPNPVSTELKVSMGKNTLLVVATLTDMYGRRIVNQTFTGATTIATAKLAAGVYMITLTDMNGVLIKQEKIVKE